jgi:DNA polymerase III subunit alpha
VTALEHALKPSMGGKCNVAVRYATGDAAAIVQFGEQWRVRPSRELIERLGTLVGRDAVELYLGPRESG